MSKTLFNSVEKFYIQLKLEKLQLTSNEQQIPVFVVTEFLLHASYWKHS